MRIPRTLILCGVLLLSSPAFAQPTVMAIPRADEPTTNADGTTLRDLQTIRFYANVVGDSAVPFTMNVPASAAGGGGIATGVMTIPITIIPTPASVTLDFWATALDLSGNESIKSNEVQKVISLPPGDTTPPGAPTLEITITITVQ